MRLLASVSLFAALALPTLVACGGAPASVTDTDPTNGSKGDPGSIMSVDVDAGSTATTDSDAGSGEDAASSANNGGAPNYVATEAVSYAADHWDDGVGLCAEFVSHCLRAGHLDIPVLPWVPDLLGKLDSMNMSFDEESSSGKASAVPGDVVFFSNGSGSKFCYNHENDEGNCGHTCIVTVGGESTSTIEVDCHNNAHHKMVLKSFFGSEFSHYRIYHLAGSTGDGSGAATDGDAGASCSSDTDCNGGKGETGMVCGNANVCIEGCHVDHDCPGAETCNKSGTPWACQ